MSPETCLKDPDEIKIFSFDWARGVNPGATVTGLNTWSVTPAGPTFASETIVTGGLKTSAKISAGVDDGTDDGTDYIVTNRVTTSDGETLEASGPLRVKHSSK